MTFLTVLAAIFGFGIIITIHEAGHFFVAKKCNVKVNEFSIGMGPAIFSRQKGETKYSLRILPIGGYCAMAGEDESSDDPRAFRNRPVWQRMLVTVAGATMNLLLGLLLILIVTLMDSAITTTTIAGFHTDKDGASISTSEQWLQKDDRILQINGLNIYTATDISYALQNDDCDTFTVVVEREGEKVTLENVEFRDTSTNGLLDFYVYGAKKTFSRVMEYTGKTFVSTARLIWISLRDLIGGKYGFHDLSGVVGIIDQTTDVVSKGKTLGEKLWMLLDLMSFITVNVGIFNLIPIPALDGGRMVFLCIEAIFKKSVPTKVEAMIHFVGLAALMLLMVAITFQDIGKIFTR